MLGVVAHGGGEFFHRGSGFFQIGRLLFGALRQILIAGGNFAGGVVDGIGGLLDAPDDIGQLGHGSIGIVAHAREHAVEVAVHAGGEVARRDRLQYRRERVQIRIGGGHQLIEAVHHRAEVVLEALCVAAHAEIAIGCGLRKQLDLAVHRRQVGLDGIHGVGEHRLFARQALHVLAQVADGVARHDLRKFHLDCNVRAHQRVGVAHHGGVGTGETVCLHAVADLAGVVALRHFALRAEDALQLPLHLAHGVEQLTGFVAAGGTDLIVQLALRDIGCHRRGAAHIAGQARQGIPAQGGDQQRQHRQAGDRLPHRVACVDQVALGLPLQRLQGHVAEVPHALAKRIECGIPLRVGLGIAALQGGTQCGQCGA